MYILRTISIFIFSIFLYSCTMQQAVEDVTTGLYEEGGMAYLDKNMTVPVDENPDKYILVEGHCDERGTREYNLALGERRANAVREYLSSMGIADGRLNVVSYGKERPDEEGSFDDAWQKNRRSVTTIDVDR